MSKFTEYLKLIPRGLPNAGQILESIVKDVQMKLGRLPEEQQKEIIRRRLICQTCPFMSKNAKTSLEYRLLTGANYDTDRLDEHCSFCGCELNMRTRALSSNCGIETWNKSNPKNQLPLKWTKFKEDGKQTKN